MQRNKLSLVKYNWLFNANPTFFEKELSFKGAEHSKKGLNSTA
jgi:hypothetical protein